MNTAKQLSARERINALLDDNSFVEIGALVTKRNTDFNLSQKEISSDGVVTGYGIIDGNPVYVYSQDSSAGNGTIGEMHAKKIITLYDLALKVGAPVIGLIDSAGLRLQEATDALNGLGEIYLKQTMASGVIPQITAILGPCGGGLAVLSALSDFSFIAEEKGKLFVNSPNALNKNFTAKCDTSSAKFQAENGNVDFVCEDESAVIEAIRELVALLPASNEDDASYDECFDDLNRLIPAEVFSDKDTSAILKEVSDDKYFLEAKTSYAKEMVTGFLRLNGMTIGAIANRRAVKNEEGEILFEHNGTLTTKGCLKAERFVRFCDAFHIPVLSLTDTEGFQTEVMEEATVAASIAKLTYAFSSSTVPKVNLIIGKAYGSAYLTMNSKHLGADMVFALEKASVGMMDENEAVSIIYDNEPVDLKEKALEYRELQASAVSAAKRGYVDAVIDECSARKHLIYAFEMLFTKSVPAGNKKRGTV
ncbi:acyl-CoA carboxylase subunit beta [Anaerocolumna chitinilytica]|uniref:Propionyl-CoA carboxylase subunit beta n=1 Tax=Anaerocolumna chitinilytica TaxID=1727145 RepID=A0A7I8DN00_9FIRM|nr:carboxyl transferase domain-containing protein [Anaerocolumna chitinilytica]BCJ99803.1 propionyl-CoA carboxylase subunit beta [Anaerocolumna chitinilytica]